MKCGIASSEDNTVQKLMQTITILMHMLQLMSLEMAAIPIKRASDSWWGREEAAVVLVTMESVKTEGSKRCP